MKKKTLILLIAGILMLLSASSCAGSEKRANQKELEKIEIISAYSTIVKDIYGRGSPKFTAGSDFCVVDLTESKLSEADQEELIKKLKSFCEGYEYTLLLDTYDGLKEKGLLDEDGEYREGFIISFKDKKIKKEKITTTVSLYYDMVDRLELDYTAYKKDGIWTISADNYAVAEQD
ncbi:MAG: hypothetical protein FWF08_01875 [Oscillospiraceae bacterium]|nr:hypothetical protein [Oscillospiraceae bacterium]